MKDFVRNWIVKADQDYRVILHELALDPEEMARDMVCFHCQQMAEKYLKAFLIEKNIEFPRTHSIEFLLEKCSSVNSVFKKLDSGNLTEYGVMVRYADDFYIPEPTEMKEQVEKSEAIRSTVRLLLNLD